MVPQRIPGGVPTCRAHCWRAWASAAILPHLTTQMSWGPSNPAGDGGRKSPYFSLARLGGATLQLLFPYGALGSQRTTACFLTRSCISCSLRTLAPVWQRDLNSCHQLSISPHFSMYAEAQSLVLPGLGVGRLWSFILCQHLLVFQDGSLWEVEVMDEEIGGLSVSKCLVGSSGFGVSGHSGGNILPSKALCGSGSSPRSTGSSSNVGDAPGSSSICPSSEAITISSPSSNIKGAMHLWRSHAELPRILFGIPKLSVQYCRAQARVSSS